MQKKEKLKKEKKMLKNLTVLFLIKNLFLEY